MGIGRSVQGCAVLLVAALLAAGCRTTLPVATPFTRTRADYDTIPVEAVRAIAADIERQVAEGVRAPVLDEHGGLTVDTPEIRQAVRTRAARVALVDAFRDKGYSWEKRDGRLWVIRNSAYKKSGTRRSRDVDAMMVNGENRDRWTIYKGLADSNKLRSRATSAIELVFFEARLELMASGQIYEDEGGERRAKP